jgi:hypothetical protein
MSASEAEARAERPGASEQSQPPRVIGLTRTLLVPESERKAASVAVRSPPAVSGASGDETSCAVAASRIGGPAPGVGGPPSGHWDGG